MWRLIEWVEHRMDGMGIESWKDLSEYSGLSPECLQDLRTRGSLDGLNRSARRLLAATLHVPLRKLEWLDEGRISWIDDSQVVTLDAHGPPRPWRDSEAVRQTDTGPENRGTPVIGRIRRNGTAEPDEDWDEHWGRRLSSRLGPGRDIYALELEGAEQWVVFRNIASWEFREGQAAVYCWNGWEAKGWFGRVRLRPEQTVVETPDGQRHYLDTVNIVRIGKSIGTWPPAADDSDGSPQAAGDKESPLSAGQVGAIG